MDIRTGYSGRTLFLTGGTGFVGKVVLFKILKEFPDIKAVYLLMRGKRSRKLKRYLKPQERLELEVLGSPCFEPLRAAVGDAEWQTLCGKVHAVAGDITEDDLGLSEQDRATIAQQVNLIIHLAATVNFSEQLDLAVQMNTLGGLRVLSLAKTCTNLEAMVHVSTCYVNYRRQGKDNVNEERIYPLGFDAEGMCKTILNLHPREVAAESKKLLKELGFPNTYTFTKCMGEHLILKYKENVPLAIVRPSIIACSYYEPMPGWVDALTAAGGIILTGALGVVRDFHCRSDMIADVVPVDFVTVTILKAMFRTQQLQKALYPASTAAAAASSSSAAMERRSTAAITPSLVPTPTAAAAKARGALPIAAAAAAAAATATAATTFMRPDIMIPAAELTPEEAAANNCAASVPVVIYQASVTGSTNSTTWERLAAALEDYMKNTKRHPRAVSPYDVTLTEHRAVYLLRYYLLRYGPYLVLKALAQLPEPVGSAEKQKRVALLGKAVRRAHWLNREFHDFVMTEWVFSCANTMNLSDGLDERSRRAFHFDPYAINWYTYTQLYTYGIFKYIVRDAGSFKCPSLPPTATELFSRAAKL